MIPDMKHRLLHLYVTAAVMLAPIVAFAAKEDEETALLDARLEGYATVVKMPSTGAGMAWTMAVFLTVVTIACLFKNARRTHLD